MSGLRAPIADVFGDSEALPALTCRASELAVIHDDMVAPNQVVSVAVPSAAQAIEISVVNVSGNPVTLRYVADEGDPDDAPALIAQSGIRRWVPNNAQLFDIRAVAGGDNLHFIVDAVVRVTVHAHIGA